MLNSQRQIFGRKGRSVSAVVTRPYSTRVSAKNTLAFNKIICKGIC